MKNISIDSENNHHKWNHYGLLPIDEKDDRIRKLEIAILTLLKADPAVHDIQTLAKQAVVSYNIKCSLNNKKIGDENVGA
jgi:hypothetical protein